MTPQEFGFGGIVQIEYGTKILSELGSHWSSAVDSKPIGESKHVRIERLAAGGGTKGLEISPANPTINRRQLSSYI
jgi:hypothetical protein